MIGARALESVGEQASFAWLETFAYTILSEPAITQKIFSATSNYRTQLLHETINKRKRIKGVGVCCA